MRSLPCSNNFISAGVVAITLVKRGGVENRVDGHGLARGNQLPLAVRFAMQNFAVLPHQQHRAGNQPVPDRFFESRVQRRGCGISLLRERGNRQENR